MQAMPQVFLQLFTVIYNKCPTNYLCHFKKRKNSSCLPQTRGTHHRPDTSRVCHSSSCSPGWFQSAFGGFLPSIYGCDNGHRNLISSPALGTPALPMPQRWHTFSTMKSLCAMGCTCLALPISWWLAIAVSLSPLSLSQRSIFLS